MIGRLSLIMNRVTTANDINIIIFIKIFLITLILSILNSADISLFFYLSFIIKNYFIIARFFLDLEKNKII